MLKKLEQENHEFVKEWEKVRKEGFGNYILKKAVSLGIMMLLIYIANYFIGNIEYYIMSAIVYLAIVIIMPFFAWLVNDIRYRKCKKAEEDKTDEK